MTRPGNQTPVTGKMIEDHDLARFLIPELRGTYHWWTYPEDPIGGFSSNIVYFRCLSKRMTRVIPYILLFLLALSACMGNYTPKPRGYFRIEFPEKEYRMLNDGYPYSFEIPVYAEAVPDSSQFAEPYWMNVIIPGNKAEIHISYKRVRNNLYVFTEESRELTYKHTQKASIIEEHIFLNPAKRVYGTIYMIGGNAASPIQFYLTDSSSHFLRGALYIRDIPNIDSLKPVIDFLVPDVLHLIETTKWD